MSVCHIVPVPSGEFCDFCTEGPVVRFYRCENFMIKDRAIFHESKEHGVWASCLWCADLADKEKWPALTERAFRKFLKRPFWPTPRGSTCVGTVHRNCPALLRAPDQRCFTR